MGKVIEGFDVVGLIFDPIKKFFDNEIVKPLGEFAEEEVFDPVSEFVEEEIIDPIEELIEETSTGEGYTLDEFMENHG